MRCYFLRIALTLVAITTSLVSSEGEYCILLCDRMKLPGAMIPYSLFQCDDGQICMQTMNYTMDMATKSLKTRQKSILSVHRHCADALACKELCRVAKFGPDKDYPITEVMSCVSCMNATTFGPRGEIITKVSCFSRDRPLGRITKKPV